MRKILFFLIVFLGGLLMTACTASDAADCKNLPPGSLAIRVEDAWSRSTDSGSTAADAASFTGSSAAYLVIHNCGPTSDRLFSVESDVANTTGLHVTQTQNGITMMGEVNELEIPAGKKVELKPGGYHIMMMDLQKSIHAGDPVHLTLTFEKAGQLLVTAAARNP